MRTREMTGRNLVQWAVPGVAVVAGLGYLVAGIAADDLAFGLGGLALMLVAGLLFMLLTRVSETAQGLADRRDERINSIDRDASLFAGMTLLLTVLVLFIVEVGQGRDGAPYYQLGALGGASYLVALLWLRWRR